jgi:hypothetical protein
MLKSTRVGFGGTAGLVISMAPLASLDAAHVGKASVIGALFIIVLADNLTGRNESIYGQRCETVP